LINKRFFFILLLTIISIAFNFIVLVLIQLKSTEISLANIFLLIVLFFLIILYSLSNSGKTKKEETNYDFTHIDSFKEITKELLTALHEVSQKILKIKDINNIDNSYQCIDLKDDYDIDNIKKVINDIKKTNYQEELELLKHSVKSVNSVVEIYHRIPYLINLLNMIPQKTEEAALSLIEKFEIVHSENSKSNNNALNNLEKLENASKGIKFEDLIHNSRDAILKYDILTNNLLKISAENGKKLSKIGDWIEQITNMLKSIEDISEQNKIISINSSIEAARLGEKGRGFQVLAVEIRKLNQKTTDFTKAINNIILSFKDYNETLLNEWEKETNQIIDSVKTASVNLESVLNILIESYEFTTKSFIELTDSTKKVDSSLNNIMESLQFQDITRQQIENVIKFLKDIQTIIKNNDSCLNYFKIKIDAPHEVLNNKIKDDLIKNVTVCDERNVIKEFNK